MELANAGGVSPHGSTVRYCEHLAMVNVLVRATRLICYDLRAFRSLISRGNRGCRVMGATLGVIFGALERAGGTRTVARNPRVRSSICAGAKLGCYKMHFLGESNVLGESYVYNG